MLCFFLPADDPFESVSDRELRQIFEGQNRIHLEIKQLNRQLDMILDEQRRYVSAVTEEIAKRGAAVSGQQGQVCSKYTLQLAAQPNFRKHNYFFQGTLICFSHHSLLTLHQVSQQEIDTVVKTQEEVIKQVNEMK